MKLLESRKWLRISEAAQYLSLNFREEVQDTDILQLVLNRQLLLSVYLFEPVLALPVIHKFDAVDSSSEETPVEYDLLAENRTVKGLVDLLPVHGGIDAIESIYRQHLGGAPTPLRAYSGLLVRLENDKVYQIQESIDRGRFRDPVIESNDEALEDESSEELYDRLDEPRSSALFSVASSSGSYSDDSDSDQGEESSSKKWFRAIRSMFRPAPELPKDCLVCISMSSLQKFVMEFRPNGNKRANDTPGDLERSSLLKLVLGMAIAKYDYRPGATRNLATGSNRGSISADLERLGLSLDSETIRKFINEAGEKFDVQLPARKSDLS